MTEVYQLPPGQDVAPGLPPVNLPGFGSAPQGPLKITVPVQQQQPVPLPPQRPAALPGDPNVAAGFTPFDPNASAGQPQGEPDHADAIAAGFTPFDPSVPSETKTPRQVGTGEAALTGVKHGLTFGFGPAIEGLGEAIQPQPGDAVYDKIQKAAKDNPAAQRILDLPFVKPLFGITRIIDDWRQKGGVDPEITAAYERGRKHALENEELSKSQHPYAYLGGVLAGGAAMPIPGAGAFHAANTTGRVIQGVRAGGIGGGLYGVGEATSEGLPADKIAKRGLLGATIGAPLGGTVSAAVGPRLVNAATPGARAARTAEDLGAPLPRGVASDSRAVQATTSKLRQIPFAGEAIGARVDATAEAAGGRIGGIADQMAGGAGSRAAADTVVRPGLDAVIQTNRNAIDHAYQSLRSQIDQNARFTMPRTEAALNRIMAARRAAGWANPAQGLEQFRNVAGGATFNGAHRARVDAREAGNALVPNPGYNAGDFNQLTRAMTTDLRDMVQAAAVQARNPPQRAIQAFDTAEREFGRLAEQNTVLQRLVNSRGEGAIATLLGAAKERGGNVRLLAQLRQSMNPQEFEVVGGTLLHELGHNNATGQFSLAQFATNWEKISDHAKNVLFSPQHRRNIDDIAGMGMHIKGALRESSTSHSASGVLLLEVAKDAALLTTDVMSGGLGAGSAVAATTSVALWTLTRWLANPAVASSMGRWARTYRAVTLGQPTPARIAAFNAATRNLANTLGVPMENLVRSIESRIHADDPAQPPVKTQDNKPK